MLLTEENVQRYVKALYPVATLLILVPLVDLSLRVFPPQFGTLQWRFATVGLFLGNLGTILLGTGLLGLVAAIAGHRRLLRGLGYATLAVGVILLAVVVLFGLDAIQIRRLANPNLKRAVLLSSLGAMFTATMGIISLFLLGRGALGASRAPAVAARRPKAAGAPVVGGRRPAPELPASPMTERPRQATAEVARPGAPESV